MMCYLKRIKEKFCQDIIHEIIIIFFFRKFMNRANEFFKS